MSKLANQGKTCKATPTTTTSFSHPLLPSLGDPDTSPDHLVVSFFGNLCARGKKIIHMCKVNQYNHKTTKRTGGVSEFSYHLLVLPDHAGTMKESAFIFLYIYKERKKENGIK